MYAKRPLRTPQKNEICIYDGMLKPRRSIRVEGTA